MEELLQQILQECRPYTGQGALASYIPGSYTHLRAHET